MSTVREIKAVATELASHLKTRYASLQRELAQIEAQRAAIEQQLKTAGLAAQRLHRFQPQIGEDFQCPRCWIERERRSILTPVSTGRAQREDFFRCGDCGFEFFVPF